MFTPEERNQVREKLRHVYLAMDSSVIFEETENDFVVLASHASERWILGDQELVHIGDSLEDDDVITSVYNMDQFRAHLEEMK